MEDGARKRREYLWKKAAARLLQAIGGVTTVGCGLLWLLALAGTIVAIAVARSPLPSLLAAGLAALVCVGAATLIARGFWRASAEAAEAIPYVPPVAEQVAALPAKEVLVRGAHQPLDSTDELLRAATPHAAVDAAELLRANDE
jgi:hypothetical protein